MLYLINLFSIFNQKLCDIKYVLISFGIVLKLSLVSSSGGDIWALIPNFIAIDASAYLRCESEINEEVFSIKWFYGSLQFYNYDFRKKEATIVHDNGIFRVDKQYSSEGTVFIRNFSSVASALMMCEISFQNSQTARFVGRMEIFSVPKKIELTASKSVVFPYDILKLNCSSFSSTIIPTFIFMINEKSIERKSVFPQHVTFGEIINNGEFGVFLKSDSTQQINIPIYPELYHDQIEVVCFVKIEGSFLKSEHLIININSSDRDLYPSFSFSNSSSDSRRVTSYSLKVQPFRYFVHILIILVHYLVT